MIVKSILEIDVFGIEPSEVILLLMKTTTQITYVKMYIKGQGKQDKNCQTTRTQDRQPAIGLSLANGNNTAKNYTDPEPDPNLH